MFDNEVPNLTAAWGADGGQWSIMVHGGAGDLKPEALPDHIEGCRLAAAEGARILYGGGSALNAAQHAVEMLEDNPLFNAGTGAVLNADGRIELDAALMEGSLLRVGAVCAMPPFLHPIAIARAVLNSGEHVLYAGEGAERFARERGFSPSSQEEMITPAAYARWQASRAAVEMPGWSGGTVGAVVRDRRGTVVAATSTGGRLNKLAGRVGDSPIPGAGTYADDDAGACSTTGDGEAMIRLCLSKTAIEWLRAGMHPEEASRAALRLLATRTRSTGGMILVDRHGRMGFARTTQTMTWAAASEGWDEVLAGG